MNREKVGRLFCYLTSKLFLFFIYTILFIFYIGVTVFLNFKVINILTTIIIGILSVLTIRECIKGIKTLKNKKRPKIYFFSLNFFSLLIFLCIPIAISDIYMAQNKDLKLFEVILNEESLELLEGLDSYEYQDVSLYHDNLDSNTLKGIEKCIDAAMQRIPDIYTNIEHTNLTFILHSDSAEFETINSGGDIQGFFNFIDKTLNMPFLKDSVIDEEFENIFKHEYNHFLIDKIRMENDIDENTIPLWFEEGVSEFYAYGNEFEKFLDYAYEEEFLNIAFTFVEYEKLKTSKNWKARSDRGYYPYTQSYYAICKLVKKNGAKAIENIIINSAKLGFEKSFKQETKISLKEFLDECKSKFIEEFDVKVENIMN